MTGATFTLSPSHWLALAFVLGILEALFPGAVFLWFAVAAGIVAALGALFPLGWRLEVILFGLLALGAVATYRAWRARQAPEPMSALNRRGLRYEGQVCELIEPIVGGQGRARVGDGVWTVSGPDLPAGSRVRVVGVDGTVLRVERLGETS